MRVASHSNIIVGDTASLIALCDPESGRLLDSVLEIVTVCGDNGYKFSSKVPDSWQACCKTADSGCFVAIKAHGSQVLQMTSHAICLLAPAMFLCMQVLLLSMVS